MILTVVAGCGLPRMGPNKRELYAGSVQRQGDAFVVSVNDRVTRATAVQPALGFTEDFLNAGLLGSDQISPGDTLGLTIWENVDDGLLAGPAANQTVLEEVQVDGQGFIFVPYAGRIKAAAKHPMLAAVKLWALAHLLVNGTLADVVLFGSLLEQAGGGNYFIRVAYATAYSTARVGGAATDFPFAIVAPTDPVIGDSVPATDV
jgi:hypothetical protein